MEPPNYNTRGPLLPGASIPNTALPTHPHQSTSDPAVPGEEALNYTHANGSRQTIRTNATPNTNGSLRHQVSLRRASPLKENGRISTGGDEAGPSAAPTDAGDGGLTDGEIDDTGSRNSNGNSSGKPSAPGQGPPNSLDRCPDGEADGDNTPTLPAQLNGEPTTTMATAGDPDGGGRKHYWWTSDKGRPREGNVVRRLVWRVRDGGRRPGDGAVGV